MEGFTSGMAVGLFILILPLFVLGISLMISAIGPLWAPIGALICARMAGKRGLNAWRYAAVGALYSILFFWPWVYLVARMDDRTLNRWLIVLFYVGTYVVLTCAVGILVFSGLYNHPGWAQVADLSNPWVWLSSGELIAAAVGVVAWWMSLTRLIKRHKVDSLESRGLRASTLPHFDYLVPVACMLTWLVLPAVSLYLANNLITTPHRFASSTPQF